MFLKSLKFTSRSTATASSDPKTARRNNIVKRLEEQKALLANPKLTRVVRKRVDKDGVKTLVESEQKIQPCWQAVGNGYEFSIRLVKWLEFAKGQTAIVLPSLKELPGAIDLLIAAVKAGELDAQLEAAAQKPVAQKKGGAKKAA